MVAHGIVLLHAPKCMKILLQHEFTHIDFPFAQAQTHGHLFWHDFQTLGRRIRSTKPCKSICIREASMKCPAYMPYANMTAPQPAPVYQHRGLTLSSWCMVKANLAEASRKCQPPRGCDVAALALLLFIKMEVRH